MSPVRLIDEDVAVRPLSDADRQRIATWQYDGDLTLYDPGPAAVEMRGSDHVALVISDGTLVGYGTVGSEAQVPGGTYPEAGDVVDIGIGLLPALVGKGYGGRAVLALMADVERRFSPSQFRVTVAAANGRATALVLREGFRPTHRFARASDGREFVQYELETRPTATTLGLLGTAKLEPALVSARWRHHYRNSLGGVTYRSGDWFLKVTPTDIHPPLDAEAGRMLWAGDYLPVPPVRGKGLTVGEGAWLLTRALSGDDAGRISMPAEQLVVKLGRALRNFHDAAPVSSCPFSFRLDVALELVAARVRQSVVVPSRDFHQEHAHLTADEALALLVQTRPESEDLVVCHGDFCLPNVLFDGGEVSGYVDLGELGIADRWWDLAIATWSVTWNLGPGLEGAFLDAYGVPLDEARRDYYRLLYDLVS